jgi:hypothetical protein
MTGPLGYFKIIAVATEEITKAVLSCRTPKAPPIYAQASFIYVVPAWFWGAAFIASFLSTLAYFILLEDSPAFYKYKLSRVWAAAPAHKEKWFFRITAKLRSKGIVSTEDFVDCGFPQRIGGLKLEAARKAFGEVEL